MLPPRLSSPSFFAVATLALAAGILPVASHAAPECSAEAQAFWQTFRSAALSEPPQVMPLTAFPLKTRGSLDSDPVVAVSQRKFPALFERLLAQDPGLGGKPTTMKAYAEAHAQLLPRMCDSNADFRVGDWVFEKRRTGWRFVFAYLNE